MKRSIIVLLLVVIVSGSGLAACWFFYKDQWSGESVITSDTGEEERVSVKRLYAPIVNITTEIDTITDSDLIRIFSEETDREAVLPSEYSSEIRDMLELTAGNIIELPTSEVIPYIISNPNAISLLPAEHVDFRVKTLSVNGIYIWDKNADYINYPFLFESNQPIENARKYLTFTPASINEITAVGEIILSRGVAERIIKYKDVLYPFRKITDMIKTGDYTIATLEAPLTKDCVYDGDTMVFCGDDSYIEGLPFAGIDLVSMAANHIKDYGDAGIEETIGLLDERNIAHVGAGMNSAQARNAVITEINGVKYGYLGYNAVVPNTYAATENSAGSAWANIDEMTEDITTLRPNVDMLIVMAHWGVEYTNQPSEHQKEIAHVAIESGADLIIGDHPHWVQGVEFYNGKFILYGIGNFVFDQMWSQETREGIILKLYTYGKTLKALKFIPTVIDDYAQPRPATKEESISIMNRIWEASVFTSE